MSRAMGNNVGSAWVGEDEERKEMSSLVQATARNVIVLSKVYEICEKRLKNQPESVFTHSVYTVPGSEPGAY